MDGKQLNIYPINEHSLGVKMDEDDDNRSGDMGENIRRSSIDSSNGKSKKQILKYVSLFTLTIQNASLTLFMRAAKTQKEPFISSTAVIMAELVKLLTCIFMVYRDESIKLYNFDDYVLIITFR